MGRLALQLLAGNPDDERVDDMVDALLSALGHAVRIAADAGLACTF